MFKPKMENKAGAAPKETKGAPAKGAKGSGKGKPAASKGGKKGC